MGSVFKQQYTKPIPKAAETVTIKGVRVAKWRDRHGKLQSAPVNDAGTRIVVESDTYYAEYTDGNSRKQRVSTGCRDKQAAEHKLRGLEQQAERIRVGVITGAEASVAAHLSAPLADHVAAYIDHMTASGRDAEHVKNVRRQLRRINLECKFTRLADLDRQTFERWLAAYVREGMSARTRNSYVAAVNTFCNWCVAPSIGRLLRNPFDGIPTLNQEADRRHKRRSLTVDELVRLLDVASRRPVEELRSKLHKAAKGRGRLRPDEIKLSAATVMKYEQLGRERALIYKTLVLTGLRVGELASLTVGQLHLDGATCYVELEAADEKNREGASLIIRSDLAADLRSWIADKLKVVQAEARGNDDPVPLRLPASTKLFNVPEKLSKIMNRDLKAAGIPKKDDRGRVVDVHALRTTFGSLMSKAGVAPPDGSGGDAAFQAGTDDERLHRPEAVGRGRGGRFPTYATPRWAGRRAGRNDRDRRDKESTAYRPAYSNFRQSGAFRGKY